MHRAVSVHCDETVGAGQAETVINAAPWQVPEGAFRLPYEQLTA